MSIFAWFYEPAMFDKVVALKTFIKLAQCFPFPEQTCHTGGILVPPRSSLINHVGTPLLFGCCRPYFV